MFASTFAVQLLAVITLLFAITLSNPIKRNAETSAITVPDLCDLTTLATSALTTGELVGVAVVSSQTVYIQEPNSFSTTVWGVPEVTASGAEDEDDSITSTLGYTPYSFSTSMSFNSTVPTPTSSTSTLPTPTFPTPISFTSTLPTATFPTPTLEDSSSVTLDTSTDVIGSTPAPIATTYVDEQPAVTTSSCNPAVAGATIPVSDLTTGEFVAVDIVCGETVYIQEPNYYPTKTYYGIPASSTLAMSNSSSTTCNAGVAGATIPVSDLTIGEFVAAYVTCGETFYIQEPNFYQPKTYYGIPASASATVTSPAAASTTGVAVEPRMVEARTGNIPVVDQTKPTSLHQAHENSVESVPSGVAGNRGAEAFRQKNSFGMKFGDRAIRA
ncbi:hypothetical protein NHQ30_004167 [Ciborinia camelliae]|nr:hypothetical protein NHQ30_004167 [Ciborinia camelliae]